ncbi:hypothetical protein [Alteromonas antoniana]|uniref:hypothetical protein n=1 Tax=Alteromonas antoniana TaxID=2803813 RepID=UPI001C48BB98|nr:hypothetical protein [Alteromonas antoniana]
MSRELFINFMRSKRVEPTEKDVKHFERMAESFMEPAIEQLEEQLDKANSLLSELREHGDFGSHWDKKITELLVVKD